MLYRAHSSLGLALALGAWFSMGSEAEAGFLLGQTLSLTVQDTNRTAILGPISFVVNDTVEIGVNNSPIVVDFNLEVDDNTITFTYTQAAQFDTATFNGYIFKAISTSLPSFGSISIDPATTLAGFKASDLSLDSTDFFVNVSGLTAFTGTVLKLDVAPVPSAVPEPSSLALCGIAGLAGAGLGVARLRRGRPV
jgi:PEP-CTERM motif